MVRTCLDERFVEEPFSDGGVEEEGNASTSDSGASVAGSVR